ncbi:MAG: 3-oxoacyl-[acyl-carrier-protein] reductase [Kiritimatiellae bacterium]|nr:3-oxoacyl-[acyl-carrier-protein] reductase [Kiritimatiellia bacterium]MCO5062023.1 3-oxoacyl-[acyl-carrier-protein] reductase [Kiritimatiellia bacterium]MCO5069286.1 3-oxoacyl-[acyl-carrier-protein] reductase [Kiritimatiellia bacterium]MCO6401628.1 3-oxoacyl-[acyl-carrier-protein] reductase [Verrucomicrobiota bacterium]
MADLNGKVAIVTGASGGIGRAVALRLAQDGADVACFGQNRERLQETADAIAALGRRASVHPVDSRDPDAISASVGQVEKDAGRIDVLVNNAGITKDGLLIRMSVADWDDVLAVNLRSVFLFTKAAARAMMKQRSGSIVNVASIIGLIGNPGQSNYAASKAGIIGFTKSIAKELASRNVRANAIAPGFITTRMTDKLDGELQKKMLELIPLARYGSPEDVAATASFLAGADSTYITGQVIQVCGGMVM